MNRSEQRYIFEPRNFRQKGQAIKAKLELQGQSNSVKEPLLQPLLQPAL